METEPVPIVQNKTSKPPGLVPKHAQTWLIAGIAFVMVIVIAFSGRNPPKDRKASAAQGTVVVDPNAARIQEYRQRIEEQARKLHEEQGRLEQARSEQARLAQVRLEPTDPNRVAMSDSPRRPYARAEPMNMMSYADASETDTIKAERAKREYLSLFASNIALSYRRPASDVASNPTASEPRARSAVPSSPTEGVRSATTNQETGTDPSGGSESSRIGGQKSPPPKSRGQIPETEYPAEGKTYRLFEGTIIEAVLTNRLDGTFSGPVNCMVTTNVYSLNGQHVLIPQGSRVLGEVRKVDNLNQERLAVVFHRLIMPDGYSVDLDQFHGLNQIGETGLRDRVNHHYGQIFGVSLAIGAIAGLAQANTNYGANASAADVYRQGVAASLAQSSLHILDRYLNVLPTFTIREGHRVKVILSDDLQLPAFENHQMPTDL